jgi:uncharacterized membrane protein YbaN (DUF454 family)
MNSQEARQVLLLYRPGTKDAEDPQVIQAIGVARTDPALAEWFKQHCAFQQSMRARFRDIPVPPHRRAMLVPGTQIPRPLPWWQRPPVWVSATATLLVLVSLAGIWFRPPARNVFANFQSRMVSTALRDYRMDIVTNDMAQVRSFLARKGAPGDYDVAPGLQRLALTGGGVLRWRNQPVSMVCFNRGDNQMLYLFVMDRSVLKDPPPAKPRTSRLHDHIAASWSSGGKTYILAGPEEPGFVEKYL